MNRAIKLQLIRPDYSEVMARRKTRMDRNYYAVLGVAPTASKEEIKRAYLEACRTHHPDKGGDEERFKEASEAWEVLGGEEREAYDAAGLG